MTPAVDCFSFVIVILLSQRSTSLHITRYEARSHSYLDRVGTRRRHLVGKPSVPAVTCTTWPDEGWGHHKEKCELGNTFNDGFEYMYNEGKGSDKAVCGESADCWCCRTIKLNSVYTRSALREGILDIGCYVYLPTGCPKRTNFDASVWTRDPNGDKFNAHTSAVMCESRRKQYNKWCGVADAQVYYMRGVLDDEIPDQTANKEEDIEQPSKESDNHPTPSNEWMTKRKLYQKYGKASANTLLDAGFITAKPNPQNATQTEYAKQWVDEKEVHKMLNDTTIHNLLKHGVLSARKSPGVPGMAQYSMAR